MHHYYFSCDFILSWLGIILAASKCEKIALCYFAARTLVVGDCDSVKQWKGE